MLQAEAVLQNLGVYLGTLEAPKPKSKAVLTPPRAAEVKADLKIESLDMVPGLRAFRYDDLRDAVKNRTQPDGVEVVDWMIESYAEGVASQLVVAAYNDAGGIAAQANGDGYIPGVSLEDGRYVSQRGSVVERQGYARAVVGSDTLMVPTYNRSMSRDHRWQFLIPWVGRVQWRGLLAKIKNVVSVPFRSDNGIPLQTIRVRDSYLTYPVPIFSYFLRPLVRVLRVDMYYPQPVPVDMYFYDGDMNRAYVVHLPKPESAGSYRIFVKAFNVPTSGYIEFYADGASQGPTIMAIDNRILGGVL